MTRPRGNGDGGEQDLGGEAVADAEPEPKEPVGLEERRPSREELEDLREELDTLQRERDELRDSLLRKRAELENFRKRVERDQQSAARDAAAEIFGRLVETVDNLERALAATGEEGALREGVELTLRELRSTLESHGVEEVDPAGQRFDPARQQALLHEEVPGVAAGTVAEVFRKGYTFKDRLLRPALVKVAASAPAPVRTEEEKGGGGEGLQ